MHQYLVESNTDGRPSTDTRSLMDQRARAADKEPFGTELDVYETDTPGWRTRSRRARYPEDPVGDLRVEVRGTAVRSALLAVGAQRVGHELPGPERQRGRALNRGSGRGDSPATPARAASHLTTAGTAAT